MFSGAAMKSHGPRGAQLSTLLADIAVEGPAAGFGFAFPLQTRDDGGH
jgi:hypothetical protein